MSQLRTYVINALLSWLINLQSQWSRHIKSSVGSWVSAIRVWSWALEGQTVCVESGEFQQLVWSLSLEVWVLCSCLTVPLATTPAFAFPPLLYQLSLPLAMLASLGRLLLPIGGAQLSIARSTACLLEEHVYDHGRGDVYDYGYGLAPYSPLKSLSFDT